MAAADATAFAERLLAELNIKPNEIRKLQEMPFDQVQEAAKKLLPGRSPRGMADPRRGAMARMAQRRLITFARSGIPKWEPYSTQNRATMILDVPCRMAIDPFREELEAWEGIPLRR
jgi:carboxylesterase type B